MRIRKEYVWPVSMITFLSAGSGFGAGFDLPDQDAFVIGRGMAFVATADNPSAIYYNPAGITQLEGQNLRLGAYVLDLQVSYKPTSGPNAGQSFDNENDLHAIPQVYYTYSPESLPLSFGLGMYVPFGLSAKWPQDTGFRTVATEGSLDFYTINPVVALKLDPTLSVAAGLTVNYANLDLQQGLIWPTQPYDRFRFEGDGWNAGYNLGVLWKPLEKLAFGLTFRSAVPISVDGHTEYYNTVAIPPLQIPVIPNRQVAAYAQDTFPLKVISGVSYRPTPSWNFEFNADFTGWSSQETLTLHQSAPFPPLQPQKDIVVPQDWQGSWYYEFGATRYFDNGWLVSAGYIFNENSVPDAHYNPLVTDLDRHFFSVGVGNHGQRFDFDVAYQFGYGPTRTVTGSAPSGIGQTADGRYEFFSHAVAVSVGVHF